MTNLRKDLQKIANLVQDGSKVLDIGCGEGDLLSYIASHKNVDARGIELSQDGVTASVQKGLAVIQGNADTDLKFYPDKCFDYVISSQMLQATSHPKEVLSEMMRIAKHVIISIPNFGYWYNRFYLLLNGRMPVSKTLSYQWYETPNIHFCTVNDFRILCDELGYKIEQQIFIGKTGCIPPFLANILSENAVFMIGA